ncbi:MAG: hypothetical protein V3U98_08795 [Acidobacteriota bacterium]
MSGIPQTPGAARRLVRQARRREILHPNEWNLIEDFLFELISKGVSDPQDAADRLERRGAGLCDAVRPFPPGGRRRYDPSSCSACRVVGHPPPGGACAECGKRG